MNYRTSAPNPCVWKEGQPLGGYLVRVARLLEDRLDASLAEIGLSAAKLTVLTQLVAAEAPVALGELALRMSCVRSNITQLVDRMEAEGLVRRVDDPLDRRAVRAALTENGRARQHDGALRLGALEREFDAKLSEEDRESLTGILAKLV